MAQQPPFPSMPFMAAFEPITRLFMGAPRKGPGSEVSTRRALSLCPLPEHPRVADLGCGSGASALLLARTLQVPVIAIDADGRSLDDLWVSPRPKGFPISWSPAAAIWSRPTWNPTAST